MTPGPKDPKQKGERGHGGPRVPEDFPPDVNVVGQGGDVSPETETPDPRKEPERGAERGSGTSGVETEKPTPRRGSGEGDLLM